MVPKVRKQAVGLLRFGAGEIGTEYTWPCQSVSGVFGLLRGCHSMWIRRADLHLVSDVVSKSALLTKLPELKRPLCGAPLDLGSLQTGRTSSD